MKEKLKYNMSSVDAVQLGRRISLYLMSSNLLLMALPSVLKAAEVF